MGGAVRRANDGQWAAGAVVDRAEGQELFPAGGSKGTETTDLAPGTWGATCGTRCPNV